jgi:hypothetical protein
MANTPRKRSLNFSKEEELLLLEEVEKFKKIVECKITNRVTCTEKNEAWQKIANNFNAKSNHCRSIEQLKAKFENLKTKARKVAASTKNTLKKTGGGPASPEAEADCVTDAVLNIINQKSVFGLHSVGDCDANLWAVPEEPRTVELSADNDNIVEEMYIVPQCCVVENENTNELDPLTLHVDIPEAAPTQSLTEKVKSAVNKDINIPQAKQNWSSYTPAKLKQPISKRLRPKIPNPVFQAKEEFYKSKTKLIENEILQLKRRQEREEEEHERKKILLDLQIELARKQLSNKN